MKRVIHLIIISLTFIFIYSPVFAGYKIYLKNGNVIIAEDIKEVGNELKIYYSAGELSIDKKEVERVVETAGSGVLFTTEEPSGEEKKLEEEKETKGVEGEQRKQDSEARLTEISKRKEEMIAERERLQKEKQELEEDIKKEGRLTSIRKERELKHRSSELEEKIKKFNEELEKLNQEEKKLLDTQKPM